MILDTPTRSLRLVLGEAHTTTACDIVACYGQQGPAGTFVTLLSQTASTGVTPVTLVAAPPVGSQNIIQEVRLHNADTVSHTVTLQLLDSATTRTIYSGTVAVQRPLSTSAAVMGVNGCGCLPSASCRQ